MKILIVEDEALTAMSMQGVLEDHGHEVVAIADDKASAVNAALAYKPDLAFVDIQLAGGDSGISVAETLSQQGIAVLFSTGNCPGEAGSNLALGCLHKPVSDDLIISGAAIVEAIAKNAAPPSPPRGMHLFRDLNDLASGHTHH